MAAAEAQDPHKLESWEDAFLQPVPAVRGMEKKLRSGALENQEKLKNLVAVNYRDLLGTARTIIDADRQMQEVEALLVDVGRRCDSRILDKIAANHSRLESSQNAQQRDQHTLASQLLVLQKCLTAVGRLLRTRGSTLLTAKLLVVSRLLHKTLSSVTSASLVSETFSQRLASLRQKLLRHIDRRFERSYSEVSELVEDMTAFSLATSSSPSDVLRHFTHLRLEAIRRPLQHEKESVKKSIMKRLQIYLDTQRETRAIYPELLQASLKALSARTLLEDPDVRKMDELGLENHLQWMSSEVKNFTPWTRQDELQQAKATQFLSTWAKDALKALMDQLSKDIRHESELESLINIRTQFLQMWLSNRRHASGIPSREVLQGMRTQFTSRFTDLIKGSFESQYTDITQQTSKTLHNWTSNSDAAKSPWDPAAFAMDIGHGALGFRLAVTDRRSGRSETMKQILDSFDSHVKDVDVIQSVINKMRESRWDDDQDNSDEEDDMSNEGPSTYHVLSRDDPDELRNALRENTVAFAQNLEHYFNSDVFTTDVDCSKPASAGIYILRLVRELRRRIPLLLQDIDREAAQHLICDDLVLKLHVSLASSIQSHSSATFATALDGFSNSRGDVKSLWEGTSLPLPVQIGPATFKTLRSTVKDMEAMGPDLWSPDAVKALRAALDEAFGQALARAIDTLDEPPERPDKAHSSNSTGTNGVASDANESHNHSLENGQDAKQEIEDSAEAIATESPSGPDTNSGKQVALQTADRANLPPANGSSEGGNEEIDQEIVRAKATQLLFDATYLANALSSPALASSGEKAKSRSDTGEPSYSLGGAIATLTHKAGLDGQDGAAMARLNKSAAEYWRRTYLLFGLLACPS